eukprot:scaffold164257_cov37-Prasinocladus_malaysianus.AAC.3
MTLQLALTLRLKYCLHIISKDTPTRTASSDSAVAATQAVRPVNMASKVSTSTPTKASAQGSRIATGDPTSTNKYGTGTAFD